MLSFRAQHEFPRSSAIRCSMPGVGSSANRDDFRWIVEHRAPEECGEEK